MKQRKKSSAETPTLCGIDVETWQMASQTLSLSYQTRQELLDQVAPHYQAASLAHKTLLLNAFVEMTGYARKSAIRLLNHPPTGTRSIQRPRLPVYGPEVQYALFLAWKATAHICAKRLVPYLPELVVDLERCGHLHLSEEHRRQLLAMSATTAERLLRTQRKPKPRGLSMTKAGTLLKGKIPIRTFADWDETQPGFLEADLVAHHGGNSEGDFLYTLTLTDIATGWTECLPLLHRSPEMVLAALQHARTLLPFPMRGLDTDNGVEFLNEAVLAYCEREQLTFTRGRPEIKNDQCYVEQKNGAVVRAFVGYDRLAGARASEQLSEVYRALRLFINCFQPSMKLLSKSVEGETVHRVYDPAKTPLQRLLLSGILSEQRTCELRAAAQTLDPLALLEHIDVLQRALLRCAASASLQPVVRCSFPPSPPLCLSEAEQGHDPGQGSQETDLRAEALRQPRSTRDPFADEWEDILTFVSAHPGCSGGQLYRELERLHPGRHTPSQLTTLAMGLRKIRAYQMETHGGTWPIEVIQAENGDLPVAHALTQRETPQANRGHVLSATSEPPILPGPAATSFSLSQPETTRETPVSPEPSHVGTCPDHMLQKRVEQSQEPVASESEEQSSGVRSLLPQTLAQAIALFLEQEQTLGRGPETLDWHQRGLKHFQQYLTRRRILLLRSVTETEVRGWLAFLRAEPSATGTLRTANTVMTTARSAHAFCAWAVRQGYLERSPFVRGMVPWSRNRESTWQCLQLIEPEIFEQLLLSCRPPGRKGKEDHATARNRAMLWMMLEMGLLVSEVCDLQLGDVDERLQMLHVQGGGARERHLRMAENTRRALRAYLHHQRLRMGKQEVHEPIFLSERCKPMTPNLVTQLFHRLSLRAGIMERWITPSMLRDTFAIRYLQAGGNLRALQEHLGLEDAVSVKRYQHYCDHALKEPQGKSQQKQRTPPR